MDRYDYVLVSTHNVVRQALAEANIPYTLIYPDESLKEEYVGRAFIRFDENSTALHQVIMKNFWEEWMDDMKKDSQFHDSIILQHNEYLFDKIILELPYYKKAQERLESVEAVNNLLGGQDE